MSKPIFLLLGNQLFPPQILQSYKKTHQFVMIESYQLCTYEKHHKQKILLFLGAMRAYAQQLEQQGFHISYLKLDSHYRSSSYTEILSNTFPQIRELLSFEVEDKFFARQLQDFTQQQQISYRELRSPMFLCSRQDFSNYLNNKKRPFLKTFYEQQRKQLQVFVDEDAKPLHGKWSFDEENRKKLPASVELYDDLPEWQYPAWFYELKRQIATDFADHPGELEEFCFPLTRAGYLKLLKNFLNLHLKNFGQYQDAITERSPWLFHSLLSPGLNLGLILPSEVLQRSIEHYEKNKKEIPFASIEGFIRQLIGWREFVRGVYQNFSERQDHENYWQHHRLMKECWYNGSTGLPPVDYAIRKAQKYAYNHHIERLMILSNVMLLSELKPQAVHRWFMEMFLDSSDWVMGPNVYGMGQFSDGGIFATKPYISGSNYILKMSDYKKGDWCEVMDGLYWRFVDKNRDFFMKNPRMKMMMGSLDKMPSEKRERIFTAAENFIDRSTYLPA